MVGVQLTTVMLSILNIVIMYFLNFSDVSFHKKTFNNKCSQSPESPYLNNETSYLLSNFHAYMYTHIQ